MIFFFFQRKKFGSTRCFDKKKSQIESEKNRKKIEHRFLKREHFWIHNVSIFVQSNHNDRKKRNFSINQYIIKVEKKIYFFTLIKFIVDTIEYFLNEHNAIVFMNKYDTIHQSSLEIR